MFLLSEHVPDNDDKIGALYKKFAHSLWYVAMSYMKDDQLAEDIVQETFLRLTACPEKIGRIDTSQTRRFLFTIAKHCCIDVLRHLSQRLLDILHRLLHDQMFQRKFLITGSFEVHIFLIS